MPHKCKSFKSLHEVFALSVAISAIRKLGDVLKTLLESASGLVPGTGHHIAHLGGLYCVESARAGIISRLLCRPAQLLAAIIVFFDGEVERSLSLKLLSIAERLRAILRMSAGSVNPPLELKDVTGPAGSAKGKSDQHPDDLTQGHVSPTPDPAANAHLQGCDATCR
ncbi:hypothetical protein BKA81DRAFT_382801 [Phyllosticta paracitricarpa]